MLFHALTNPNAPRLAEGTRSGRTLRDITLNLAAIRDGLSDFVADAPAADRVQLDKAFDEAQAALKAMDKPNMKAEEQSAEVKQAVAAVTTLSQTAIALLPHATGLTLGFNNLDGD
jgi:predicted lipoprotein